jgi:hypothetical protein
VLVGRALERCGARARDLRRVHRRLLDLAHALGPDDPALGLPPRSGATIRTRPFTYLRDTRGKSDYATASSSIRSRWLMSSRMSP